MNPFDKLTNRTRNVPSVDLTQGRTIAHSRSLTRTTMGLTDANIQGNVHGGVIMRMVDDAAAIVAFKHCQNPKIVTARVERFDFLAPAFMGDVVTVNCEMQYVGRTSMEVGVEVTAEDVLTGEIRKIASSYVIYVSLDENRKPTPVPPLIAGNAEEQTIIDRARIRRQRRHKIDEELAQEELESL
jgi:acyl-CoA hydrolase